MFQELEINNDFLEITSKINDGSLFEELRGTEMLSTICTFRNSLPQGAPTSPVISNIIFSKIDREILKICDTQNITYTRYADDVTFSGNNKRELQELVNQIKLIINSSDFKINPKKSRMMNGQRATIVTGLRLNANKLSIGNKRKKLLRAKIFNWIMHDDIREKEHIQGELAYLKSIEEDTHAHFIRYIEKLKKRKGETPDVHNGEYDTAQGYITHYYAIMNKYYHRPIKMRKSLDIWIDGLIISLQNESYPVRKLFVDKICNFLEIEKRMIYVVRGKRNKINQDVFQDIISPVFKEELAHNNAKYIKWTGQLQEFRNNNEECHQIYRYCLTLSFCTDKNIKTMRLLFRDKWGEIYCGDFRRLISELDNYNELLTKAEYDYGIFYQYYLSSGHLSTECAEILEQWKFMIHHLRAYHDKMGEYASLRDYAIRNELIEKSRKIKSNYPHWVVCFFHDIIDGDEK